MAPREVPSEMQQEAALLEAFAEIPNIAAAWVLPLAEGAAQLTVGNSSCINMSDPGVSVLPTVPALHGFRCLTSSLSLGRCKPRSETLRQTPSVASSLLSKSQALPRRHSRRASASRWS